MIAFLKRRTAVSSSSGVSGPCPDKLIENLGWNRRQRRLRRGHFRFSGHQHSSCYAPHTEFLTGSQQALFTLVEQRQFIMNLKRRALDPKKDGPIRTFSIQPLQVASPSLPLNVEALGFLLQRDGELLNQLALADIQFRTLAALLDARSALHRGF